MCIQRSYLMSVLSCLAFHGWLCPRGLRSHGRRTARHCLVETTDTNWTKRRRTFPYAPVLSRNSPSAPRDGVDCTSGFRDQSTVACGQSSGSPYILRIRQHQGRALFFWFAALVPESHVRPQRSCRRTQAFQGTTKVRCDAEELTAPHPKALSLFSLLVDLTLPGLPQTPLTRPRMEPKTVTLMRRCGLSCPVCGLRGSVRAHAL